MFYFIYLAKPEMQCQHKVGISPNLVIVSSQRWQLRFTDSTELRQADVDKWSASIVGSQRWQLRFADSTNLRQPNVGKWSV